jgi:hypothetical protein
MMNTDPIVTMADFFFEICGHSDNFKKVLKGDTATAKGIDAINKANSEMLLHEFNMTMTRVTLFNAMKTSTDVLDSGKLRGLLKEAQGEFKAGAFPKNMAQLDLCGGDLKDAGVKPGPGMGEMLTAAVTMVMGGVPNDKDTLLKALMDG